ncbi:MAG TPA: hypothetical protein VG407_11280 [Caulobacteraceae bacterium]|jgi:hypothetical protein|nr:hypothetical protein [Caulobacteraceae bacterium]
MLNSNLRKLVVLASALAVAATALPAAAADTDLLFPGREASNMTRMAANQPYWALLAECAGVFGAASQWEKGKGNSSAADEDKDTGARFLTDAIERLKTDHKISDQDALAYASDEVSVGHNQGAELLANGDISANSQWNWKRGACLEIQETYHHDTRRRRS